MQNTAVQPVLINTYARQYACVPWMCHPPSVEPWIAPLLLEPYMLAFMDAPPPSVDVCPPCSHPLLNPRMLCPSLPPCL